MTKRLITLRSLAATLLRDVLLALILLTRLPLPHLPKAAFARQAQAVWAFPLAGLLIAAPSVALAVVSGLPPALAAGLCLGLQMLLSGAMHEDGLADCCDGFWGGFEPARRLEIMKDSQIGTYGVLGLGIATGLRWLGYAALLEGGAIWAVVGLACFSRSTMGLLMASLCQARARGLAQSVGRPDARAVGLGLCLGLGLLCAFSGWSGLVAAGAAGVACLCLGRLAQAKIGGVTGDVLGACQQMSEIAALLVLVAALP